MFHPFTDTQFHTLLKMSYINIYCWLQVVTIDIERPISEKQNKVSAEGARLTKKAMLSRDIFKFTKPSQDAFRPFGLISRACQGPIYRVNTSF